MIDTDETLLERVKSMDAHDAWQEFFKSYWLAILRYARKLGLNEHQAQDVLQDTMVALMRIMPGFTYDNRKGRFRNFLLTIVHRKSLTALRRARGVPDVSLDETDPWGDLSLHDLIPASTINADRREAELRWKETLMEEVIEHLASDPALDADTFAVFRAYAIEGRPVLEVAAKFGLTENAVYQIKNRLTRRLQARVADLLRDSGSAGIV